MKSIIVLIFTALSLSVLSGCVMMPGGVAASSTPINGRDYVELGRASETDSRVYLLWFLPVTGANTIRDAINEAVDSRNGDALINVTVESYSQWWVLFSRHVTRVEGEVIRFR